VRSSMLVRGAALGTAAALIGLSAAPAQAATPVARASATALEVSVTSSSGGLGGFSSTHDGTTEETFGANRPQIQALGGQDFLSAGVLYQDATTSVSGDTGNAAACSGLAGQGATVVQAGDGNCLSGGETLSLADGSLDLSNIDLVEIAADPGIEDALLSTLQGLGITQDQLTGPLQTAIDQAMTSLGSPGLHIDLGAVQSECTASGSETAGSSTLASAGAYLEVPQIGRVDLVKLPVTPAPNTKVVTDLDALTGQLLQRIRSGIAPALLEDDVLGPILTPLEGVTSQLTTQLGDALAPLEQNVLSLTLNRQVVGDGRIAVTALDLQVLPAARQFVGTDLARVQVGTSVCGPNGRVARPVSNPPAAAPPAAKAPPAKNRPPAAVPTAVPAGVETAEEGRAGTTALVALLLLGAAGTGVITYRRLLQR